MTGHVRGHIGSKAFYQTWVEPTRWSSLLAHPDDVKGATKQRQFVENVKKQYLNTANFYSSALTIDFACVRHLKGVLPAVAVIARRPGLFDLFITRCFKPLIGVSYGVDSYRGLAYLFCGGLLKDLAKQRYLEIGAKAFLEASNWVTTALFLQSYGLLGSTFGQAKSSSLEKLSFYGFCASYVLASIQMRSDYTRYGRKESDYRGRWFDSTDRRTVEAQIDKLVCKKHACARAFLELVTKAVGLGALRIMGIKTPLAVIVLEVAPLAATYIRNNKTFR